MTPAVAAVVPNWNGRHWLPTCLDAIRRQSVVPNELIVVDNGSTDGSRELLSQSYPEVRVIALERNVGFAAAANAGIQSTDCQAVALINTDVELAADWVARMAAVLEKDPGLAAVTGKMVDSYEPGRVYDAGDILRRDGVCEQRGRFEADDGRFDDAGDVFGACAGAALYRREAVRGVGGFDERYFAYLEDVELALRLRLAGWRCAYEPAVARHVGEGSSTALPRPVTAWVERNTLLLVARHFPARWWPQVTYRQLAWAWRALRERRLRTHLEGATAALALLPTMLRERWRQRPPVVCVRVAVPARPIRQRRG